ncbi:MAG TPA: DUF4405 domain-containing protein, partial [Arachidicoccus sp.]
MKGRNLVSLFIAFSFIAIASTGLLLYLGIKSEMIETVHVLFGLLFSGFATAHIWLNFKSLKKYLKNRHTNFAAKELIGSMGFSVLLLAIIVCGFSFPDEWAHAGRNLPWNKKEHNRDEQIVMSRITTNEDVKGMALQLFIIENPEIIAPVITIWAENPDEEYYENLFVPAKIIKVPVTVHDSKDLERSWVKGALQYSGFDYKLFPEYQQRNAGLLP